MLCAAQNTHGMIKSELPGSANIKIFLSPIYFVVQGKQFPYFPSSWACNPGYTIRHEEHQQLRSF